MVSCDNLTIYRNFLHILLVTQTEKVMKNKVLTIVQWMNIHCNSSVIIVLLKHFSWFFKRLDVYHPITMKSGY